MASLRRRPGHRVPRSPRIITAEKIIETQNNNCLTQTHFLCKIWTEFNHCNKGSMVKTLRALIFILDISIFTQQPVMMWCVLILAMTNQLKFYIIDVRSVRRGRGSEVFAGIMVRCHYTWKPRWLSLYEIWSPGPRPPWPLVNHANELTAIFLFIGGKTLSYGQYNSISRLRTWQQWIVIWININLFQFYFTFKSFHYLKSFHVDCNEIVGWFVFNCFENIYRPAHNMNDGARTVDKKVFFIQILNQQWDPPISKILWRL